MRHDDEKAEIKITPAFLVSNSDTEYISIEGTPLNLRPGMAYPQQWLDNTEICLEYYEKFGVKLDLPFWFTNAMTEAQEMIKEAIQFGRRRWILECGLWGSKLPIHDYERVIEEAGKSLQRITLRDTKNLWLDPVEWIEK